MLRLLTASRFAGGGCGWLLVPVPDDRMVLAERTGPTRIMLPARRCRLTASFALAGTACAAVRFGVPVGPDEDFDLVAIAGHDRILALEPWSGRSATGAHFTTRLDLLPGGQGVILRRDAARPNATRTVWERRSWTDTLSTGATVLIDAPVRPPVPGTWQAAVAGRRAAMQAHIVRPVRAVDPSLASRVVAWPWETAGPPTGLAPGSPT